MWPQDSQWVLGLFCWTETKEAEVEAKTRHYLVNGSGQQPEPREALAWAGETQAQMVDLKFCDLLGAWQHMTLPLSAFDESAFDEGLGFDGSSIRGWQGISESDMLLLPDASSALLDPFAEAPTLSLLCEIVDPITREPYVKDPRRIAKRAEEYLRETGVADTAYFGPECEFFVLDTVSYELADHKAHYEIDSSEGHWNSAKPGLGYTVRPKEGYFPPAPHDTLADLRTQMVLTLERLGIPCEFHHHEVASGGQCEIDLRFQSLTRMADEVMTYKYVVKNVARAAGKTVTFMPKPLFGDNGSGMHTHQSLWKEGTPLMADKSGYAGLSQLARTYIGGLLAHAPALLAFCAPTTNSYRRLVPGFEAPVNLVYSMRNRSACIRIPMYSDSPKAKRIEFRCPDAAANPYLAFSAMLMAGLDGIEQGLDAGEPADWDLFEADRGVPQVPGSLAEALAALETDHEFLLKGDVFSEELIRTWIDYKRESEVDIVRLRPHPAEFALYYDC
jgi:glutamine synthetase